MEHDRKLAGAVMKIDLYEEIPEAPGWLLFEKNMDLSIFIADNEISLDEENEIRTALEADGEWIDGGGAGVFFKLVRVK